jgi:Spy/CpxP family protein refolding chaperone
MNRKVLAAWIAVVVMVVFAAGIAIAQRGPRHGGPGAGGPGGMLGMFGGRMLAHIEARLNLTDAQTQQIRQITQQQREQAKQKFDRDAHEALMRQVFSDNPNQAEIQKLTQQLQQQHAQMLQQLVSTGAQINQVLNAEQRAELQEMIAEHHQVREKMKQRREERRQQRQQKPLPQ